MYYLREGTRKPSRVMKKLFFWIVVSGGRANVKMRQVVHLNFYTLLCTTTKNYAHTHKRKKGMKKKATIEGPIKMEEHLTLNHYLEESCPELLASLLWTLCEHKTILSYFNPLRCRGIFVISAHPNLSWLIQDLSSTNCQGQKPGLSAHQGRLCLS